MLVPPVCRDEVQHKQGVQVKSIRGQQINKFPNQPGLIRLVVSLDPTNQYG